MKINTEVLARDCQDANFLKLKFSKLPQALFRLSPNYNPFRRLKLAVDCSFTEDGKEMELDTEKLSVKDVMEEVDRHSRVLKRQADLSGN